VQEAIPARTVRISAPSGGTGVLMVLLFGWPLAAVLVVGFGGHTGMDAARPFLRFGLAGFLVAGVLLVATLLSPDSAAVNFLLLGTASFGGAISCGVTALVIWSRESHKRRSGQQRPWPPREEP
jgi:hypothetical protein